MTPERFAHTALGLPGASLDLKWSGHRIFCVGAKMFASAGHDDATCTFRFKASDMAFAHLIDQRLARPAPYLARASWVELVAHDALPDIELTAYLREAHALVASRLPRRVRMALGL